MRRVGVIVDADIKPFSAALARAAAEAAAFEQRLNRIGDQRVNIRVDADRTSIRAVQKDLDGVSRTARQTDTSINQLTGRLRLFADAAAILGPALAPIGALAVPAVTGLANQLGFAAAAGGTALLAFQGVGDAVTAMNEYALEPTAENLLKVEEQLSRLSPQAAEFARGIGDMRDTFIATRDAAAEGLFPELTASLDDLDGLLARVQPVLREIGSATGEMLADGLESLNSDRWQPFFDFLQAEAKPVLSELGTTAGDFAHGLAEMWMAFQPLNRDFGSWLADVADGFDGWAAGLSQTEGFNEFIAYIRDNGPQVADTMSALGGALVDIAVAASPFGGPVLAGLEAFANVVSAIASSNVGPAIVGLAGAMALLNRTMAVGSKIGSAPIFGALSQSKGQVAALATSMGVAEKRTAGFRTALNGLKGAAGPIAGLALASSDLGDKAGMTAVSMGLMGSAFGPWGALAGVAVGGVMELAAANDNLEQSADRVRTAIERGSLREMSAAYRQMGREIDETEASTAGFLTTFGGVGLATSESANDFVNWIRGVGKAKEEAREFGDDIEGIRNPMSGLGGLLAAPFHEADGAIRGAALSMVDFADQAKRLGNILGGEASLIQYRQAMDDLRASLAQNGNNFNTMTQAGRDNASMLLNAAGAGMEYAKTLKGMERIDFLRNVRASLQGIAGEFPAAERLVGRITRQLEDLGATDVPIRINLQGARNAVEQGQMLGAQLGGLDKIRANPRVDANTQGARRGTQNAFEWFAGLNRTTATPKVNSNTRGAMTGIRTVGTGLSGLDRTQTNPSINARDNASGVIAGVRAGLAGIQSKSVTITTYLRTVRTGTTIGGNLGIGSANGNFFSAYANGGMDLPGMHAPEFAGPGPTRIWREPETGGESYIPHRNDARRPRAKSILEQTAGLFGGEVRWFADGGQSGSLSGGGNRGGSGGGGFADFLREQRENRRERKREHRELLAMLQRQTRGDQTPKELRRLAQQYKKFQEGRDRRREQREEKAPAALVRGDGPFAEYQRALREASAESRREREAVRLMLQRMTPGKQTEKQLDKLVAEYREFRREMREQAAARAQAAEDFAPTIGDDFASLSESIRQFELDLVRAGGTWTDGMDADGLELIRIADVHRDLSEQAEKAATALSEMTSEADDFGRTVSQRFNNDIFGGSLGDLKLQLEADRNDSNSILAAFKTAEGKGLDGEFAKAFYQGASLDMAKAFAALSPSEIAQYEALYGQRATAQQNLGNFARQDVYGEALAQASATNTRLIAQMDQQQAAFTAAVAKIEASALAMKENVRTGAEAGSESGSRKGSLTGTLEGYRGATRARDRFTTSMVKIGPGGRR